MTLEIVSYIWINVVRVEFNINLVYKTIKYANEEKKSSSIKRVLIIFWLWKLKKKKKHAQNIDALFSVRTIEFCILMPSSAFLETSFCVRVFFHIIIYHQSLPHKNNGFTTWTLLKEKRQLKLLLSKDFQLILFVLHIEFMRSI